MPAPNIQREALSRQLAHIVSRPEYIRLLAERNAFQSGRNATALRFAEKSIDYAFGPAHAPRLLDPVLVTELVANDYPIHLYRVFDGVDRAPTLGGWWGDRKLVRRAVHAASKSSSASQHADVIKVMLNAMFVHPHWNRGKDIARLTVPVGNRTPVIIGLGDWRAMRSARDPDLPPGVVDPTQDRHRERSEQQAGPRRRARGEAVLSSAA